MFDKNILNSHSILVVGNDFTYQEKLRKEISNQKRDERYFNLLTFGIDESHELLKLASALDKPTTFFVVVNLITNEAQNALLKLTEEPSKYFQLVITVPTDQNILPTFISRFRVVFVGNGGADFTFDVNNFLKASVPKRIKMLEPYIEHPEDEEEVKVRKDFFLNFVRELHKELSKAKNIEGLKILSSVDSYGGMTAPSFKMFFEHLATNLPIL